MRGHHHPFTEPIFQVFVAYVYVHWDILTNHHTKFDGRVSCTRTPEIANWEVLLTLTVYSMYSPINPVLGVDVLVITNHEL